MGHDQLTARTQRWRLFSSCTRLVTPAGFAFNLTGIIIVTNCSHQRWLLSLQTPQRVTSWQLCQIGCKAWTHPFRSLRSPVSHKHIRTGNSSRGESNLPSLRSINLWSHSVKHIKVSILGSCFQSWRVRQCVASFSEWDGKSFTVSADPFESYYIRWVTSRVVKE